MTEDDLAALSHGAFLRAFGDVFEHSAWIADVAWSRHAPFRSFHDLYVAMIGALDEAGEGAAISLVRAHPDLAGKAALAGELTHDSTAEQASSGLSSLTADELARFTQLNAAYKAKFAFPFVMAVRKSDKVEILAAFEQRLQNDPATELATAIDQVKTIARWRIEAIAAPP